MIDDLDRIMTAYGTISVKTPDVWGQDRLSKFRSEYEAEMAAWLKVGFKGDINASGAAARPRRLRSRWAGTWFGPRRRPRPCRRRPMTPRSPTWAKWRMGLDATLPASQTTPDKTPVTLEPTVVLDEHSNYLNHLNQFLAGSMRATTWPTGRATASTSSGSRRRSRPDPGAAGARGDHHGLREAHHDQAHAPELAPGTW